jgi:hypothetical protein
VPLRYNQLTPTFTTRSRIPHTSPPSYFLWRAYSTIRTAWDQRGQTASQNRLTSVLPTSPSSVKSTRSAAQGIVRFNDRSVDYFHGLLAHYRQANIQERMSP